MMTTRPEPCRRPLPPYRQRGAALLLLLVVASLGAAALLMQAFDPARAEARRVQRTLLLLADARDALIGYAVSNGRLPRPAISATDGRERASCASEADCSGLLPWVTLGVAASDAWGKQLRYSVTPAMTVAPIHVETTLATKTVLGRDGQGRLFYLAGFDTCSVRTQCLPAVVLSTGGRNFGVTANGIVQANAGQDNEDERLNAYGSTRFVARAASGPLAVGGEFDDLVLWLPLPLLYNRMNAAHQLP
jgi:type II secretory pathway pseudopilin PulG